MKKFKIVTLLLVVGMVLAACGGGSSEGGEPVSIAGSSTVNPVTAEAIDSFMEENPDADITQESTGTGGGFELFTKGETDMNNASRAINDEEQASAEENGIDFTELYLGDDGVTVIISNENDFAKELTSDQLKMIFDEATNGQYLKWSDIDPSFPEETINLYGPTTASGTYDFFTEEIIGDEDGASLRNDMAASEDDNLILNNVSKDPYGIAFLGFAYYNTNSDAVQSVTVDGVAPTMETIGAGEYVLSRPLFIYVSNASYADNETFRNFVDFYMENAEELVNLSGYVSATPETHEEQAAQLEELV